MRAGGWYPKVDVRFRRRSSTTTLRTCYAEYYTGPYRRGQAAKNPTNIKLSWALKLAALGFRIHPLAPNSKIPGSGDAWKADATTDPDMIRMWFTERPDINYLVEPPEGFAIFDIDMKDGKNGRARLLELEEQHQDAPLPDTFIVETTTGGFHQYGKGHAPSSVGRIADGVDVRGNMGGKAGYVVGPGSTLIVDGEVKEYRVVEGNPIAEMPQWLIDAAQAPVKEAAAPERDVAEDEPAALLTAKGIISTYPVAVEGKGGDEHTYKLCCKLIRDLHISTGTAFTLLQDWNSKCEPPWEEDELRKKLANAADYGQNPPGARAPTPGCGSVQRRRAARSRPHAPQVDQ